MKGINERTIGLDRGPEDGAHADAAWGRALRPVAWLLRDLLRLPFANLLLNAGLRLLRNRGQNETAARLAIAGLRRYRSGGSVAGPKAARRQWWRCLAAAIEALDGHWHDTLRADVLTLATELPAAEGPEAARALMGLARWKSDDRDYEGAHALASLAAEADPNWAEPDFLLGWCGLLLARMDAAEWLGRAVEKDHRMLFRIVNDPICKRRPHIVTALKKRSLASGIVIEALS